MKFYFLLALLVFLVIGLSVMGIRTILDLGRFDFFNQVGLPRAAVLAWAVYTVVGVLLMVRSRTLVVGYGMLLLNNIFIIGVYAKSGNSGSAALEALAMGFPIVMLWAHHTYDQWKKLQSTLDKPSTRNEITK